jgi:transposase-like protein
MVKQRAVVLGELLRLGMLVGEALVARVIENTDTKTLQGFVKETVSDKVSLVATDEHSGYAKLTDEGFPHQSVKHGQGEYVRGNAHTQNIDSFWSLLKRGVIGTFHKVSKEYLPLYVNEFVFRHNNRKNPRAFADLITTRSQ